MDRTLYEHKRRFVEQINETLLNSGDDRYSYLAETPLVYQNMGGVREIVVCNGQIVANVTGDSLAAMLEDISKGLSGR